MWTPTLTEVIFFSLLHLCWCDYARDAGRLYRRLMLGYNKNVVPTRNGSEVLKVYLGIRLYQFLDVDEKNQVVIINVWMKQAWHDYRLTWSPANDSGITHLYFPPNEIWTPDIVLYNNADGNFELTIPNTRAKVYYDGLVIWEPPAFYFLSCVINVLYFPADRQLCQLRFGSWSYDYKFMDLMHLRHFEDPRLKSDIIPFAMDLSEYDESVEFDLVNITARRRVLQFKNDNFAYVDLVFDLQFQRKILFYTINLIIPCACISFLTILVFYLPVESGEKCGLCITILLTLTMFLIQVSDIMPPTSMCIPMFGKYLLFIFIIVSSCCWITICVLNFHFRSDKTHEMSEWMRYVFLYLLPKILRMKKPDIKEVKLTEILREANELRRSRSREKQLRDGKSRIEADMESRLTHETLRGNGHSNGARVQSPAKSQSFDTTDDEAGAVQATSYTDESSPNTDELEMILAKRKLYETTENLKYIADHLKSDDESVLVREEWKYVAMVLDRFFLWTFSTVCVCGTAGLLLHAPTLYDNMVPLTKATYLENMLETDPAQRHLSQ